MKKPDINLHKGHVTGERASGELRQGPGRGAGRAGVKGGPPSVLTVPRDWNAGASEASVDEERAFGAGMENSYGVLWPVYSCALFPWLYYTARYPHVRLYISL